MSRAFSLVELSIVLVILGLLVGGVLTGQSLVRAAEIRAVGTELQSHIAAIQSFRGKYFAIPGDMNNATKFWGTALAGTNCAITNSTTTATCDGNADTQLGYTGYSNERFRFWQHLANAQLIGGNYSGIAANGTANGQAGDATNSPTSRIRNAYWSAYTLGSYSDGTFFLADYGNLLQHGGWAGGTVTPSAPQFRTEELWNIDTKYDDGQPARGKILARYWSTCTTATANTDVDATYKLTSSTNNVCTLIYAKAY